MRPSKKGKPQKESGLPLALILQTVLGTLALTAASAWFARQAIWRDESRLQCMVSLSQSKALLRVQSDVLDEALRNVGNLRESLVSKSAELRAMAAREQFSSERDRAAFDEFVVSLGRDEQAINSNSGLKGHSSRPQLRETAQRIKSDIASVFGVDFFKGTVQLMAVRASDPEEADDGGALKSAKPTQPVKADGSKAVVHSKEDDAYDKDDDNEQPEKKASSKPQTSSGKKAPGSIKKGAKAGSSKAAKGASSSKKPLPKGGSSHGGDDDDDT
jgi:hypothetical protein